MKKEKKRTKIHKKIRVQISGTNKIPRLCVFRSLKHIYAQLIDDEKGKILVSSSDLELKQKTTKGKESKPSSSAEPDDRKVGREKRTEFSSNSLASAREKEKRGKGGGKVEMIKAGKIAKALEVGQLIAQKALLKKIDKVVFDRAGYKYHGRVKSLAEGAREAGLRF